MRYVEYIEFKSGWRPPTFDGIAIQRICRLRVALSKNGNPYTVYLGQIEDDDAIILKLRDVNAKVETMSNN